MNQMPEIPQTYMQLARSLIDINLVIVARFISSSNTHSPLRRMMRTMRDEPLLSAPDIIHVHAGRYALPSIHIKLQSSALNAAFPPIFTY
jgi:hypothetical protein